MEVISIYTEMIFMLQVHSSCVKSRKSHPEKDMDISPVGCIVKSGKF